MKILSMIIAVVAVLSLSFGVYAKETDGKTQREGEENQLQVIAQEQETEGTSQGQAQGIPKSEAPRSETARAHMSVVAQKVEELLTTRTTQGGIGEQVRLIAQAQKRAQDQLRAELENVDGRNALLRSLIGPDYKALKNIRKQIEQNQLRIQQLEQLQSQLTFLTDKTLLEEAIAALTAQNTALQDRINLEEQSGSLLGWLFKLLS